MVQLKREFIHHRDTEIAPKATANFNFILENEKTTRALFLAGAAGDFLKPDHHQEPNAPAAWRYFEIWMQIRSELQKAEH